MRNTTDDLVEFHIILNFPLASLWWAKKGDIRDRPSDVPYLTLCPSLLFLYCSLFHYIFGLRRRICQRWTSLLILTVFPRWFLVWCVWRSLKPLFWQKFKFSIPQPGWVCRRKEFPVEKLRNIFLLNNDKFWIFNFIPPSLAWNLTPFPTTNFSLWREVKKLNRPILRETPIRLSGGSWAGSDVGKESIYFSSQIHSWRRKNYHFRFPKMHTNRFVSKLPKSWDFPWTTLIPKRLLVSILLLAKWYKNCQDLQLFNWHILLLPTPWLLSKMLEFEVTMIPKKDATLVTSHNR